VFKWYKALSEGRESIKDELLRKRVVRMQPSIANNWMLLYENAPCHMAISVIKFLAKKGIPVVPQPPHSPDLSPCDFFCSQN